MTGVFLHLSEDWALGHDHNQWILYKCREKKGLIAWRPVAFIATNKLVLHRVLKEVGCCPTANAQRLLDQLPDTFSEWITPDQIEEWSLPLRPTKKSDTRAKNFQGGSVEVDAIPPVKLRELAEERIEQHIDKRQLQVTNEAERSEQCILDKWAEIAHDIGGAA